MGKEKRHEGAHKGRSCCGGGSPEDCLEISDRRTHCYGCGHTFRRSQLDESMECLDCAAMVRCEGRQISMRCVRRRPSAELTYGLCELCLAVTLGLIPSLLDEATWVTPFEPPDDE